MNSQHRRRRLFDRSCWYGRGISLLSLVTLNGLAASPIDPPLSKTKQEANRLVAMTKPGFYKALLVPDWRLKQVNTTPAMIAATSLCGQANTKSGSVGKPLQLTGERLDEKQVRLRWQTSDDVEENNFIIERSVNPADDFKAITFLGASRQSSATVTYQTIDLNPATEFTYYRLKRVDLPGSYTYSPIIAVKGELPPLIVKAFPNPGQPKTVMFEVSGADATKPLSIVFYDIQGRILYQHEQSLVDTDGRFSFPTLPSIQPGRYYLRVITTGQQVVTPFVLEP